MAAAAKAMREHIKQQLNEARALSLPPSAL
jgi:hypothetical protein